MALRPLAVAQRGIALAASGLVGPFLSPGSLTAAERLRLIDGVERVLEGVYTHLPLKRARYGFDPVQRLRILRSQLKELSDDAFHVQLADIITRLRDAHTLYTGPASLESKVAALPFLVEMIGSVSTPTYVVTKVGHHLDSSFKPGVVLEYWNGVPIDRAVLRHAEEEFGGRPDSQRAWAVQSLTLRSLQYGPPPDEHWVILGYLAGDGAGPSKEIKLPWQIVDPSEVDPLLSGGPTGTRAKALRRTRAVHPAAEAIRRAKMLLFAPHALKGSQATAPKPMTPRRGARRPLKATIISTELTKTLKVMSIDAPGGPFGYLRIFGFDEEPGPFIDELIRLIPLLPDRGLIIDIRGNPGGYIWAAELALQLFTPNRIEPTRFSALATPFTRQIASIGDVAEDLAPWKRSLDEAVRNGELYAQTIPITDPDACNALGQMYGGPVVLVADSTTYSSGDLFSAGFVDNRMGPFMCVGSATGAGGANVWSYGELRKALAGSPAALPTLPDGIDLSFAFRRATRARANEGIPIEDVGISGTSYEMTRDDLLNGNPDLIATCIRVLKEQPFSRLTAVVDTAARTIQVATSGLDLVDAKFDGHSGASGPVDAQGAITISYPPRTKTVELAGCLGPDTLQRRRISLRP
ncbi:MAG TPA: S41 family peptidase [Vicinamibacterales bacterium]|nr:S41 family peptidase [Vicinamibacterales bacterium]